MKARRIETDVWHVMVFFWAYKIWRTFASADIEIDVPRRTNRCQYLWTIGFFAPIAILFYASTFGFLLWTVIYYPTAHFGWSFWFYGIGGVATLAAAVALVYFLGKNFIRVKEWNRRRIEAGKMLKEMMEGSEERPSLFALAKEYWEEKDFCQTIEFIAPPAKTEIEQVKVKNGFAVAARMVSADASEEVQPQPEVVSFISTERIGYTPAWWAGCIFIILAFVCFMIMAKVAQSNIKIAPIWEGSCKTSEWHNKGFVSATLICNGKTTEVSDNETLVEMLNTGNPITCFESEEEKFYCLKSDQERKK